MSRNPVIRFVFFPASLLLFCAASLFWQFNPVVQAFKQSYANTLLSNEPDLAGKAVTTAHLIKKQVSTESNDSRTMNKAGNPIKPTKLILPQRLAKHSNKMRNSQISGGTKKVVAEIEIVEIEDPHNWSNVSSFLRNNSAINLESTDDSVPSVLPEALRFRAAKSRSNSAKIS